MSEPIDLIADGVTGFLYEAGNSTELRRTVELLARDPAMRARMGVNLDYPVGKPDTLEYVLRDDAGWREGPVSGNWFPDAFMSRTKVATSPRCVWTRAAAGGSWTKWSSAWESPGKCTSSNPRTEISG